MKSELKRIYTWTVNSKEIIPILYEEILNLIIKDRKPLKMNMPAYMVKIKVQVSAELVQY